MLSEQQVLHFNKVAGRIEVLELEPSRYVISLKETDDKAVWYFKRRHCFYTHRDLVVLPAFYALVRIVRKPASDSYGVAVVLESKETNRFAIAIRKKLYTKLTAT
jgi:hypothetical protein